MADSVGWVIRPAAQVDLEKIWRHSALTWSVDQVDRYIDGLFGLFDLLADFPAMARERPEFRPPVRIHSHGAHMVIYRAQGEGVEIIRIVHAHQKLAAYLAQD